MTLKERATRLYTAAITLAGAALFLWNPFLAVYAIPLGLIVNMLGHSIGYHRLFTHRSFEPRAAWIGNALIVLGAVTGRGSPLGYAAIHQTHHTYSDTYRDPHKPGDKGFVEFFFEHFNLNPDKKIAIKVLRSHSTPLAKFLHQHLLAVNIATLALVTVLGFVQLYLMSVFVALVVGVSVNYFGHANLKPTNRFWLGLLTLGEGFHGSHHERPRDYRFHWADLGGYVCEWIKK